MIFWVESAASGAIESEVTEASPDETAGGLSGLLATDDSLELRLLLRVDTAALDETV
jgi:hypothetical protein